MPFGEKFRKLPDSRREEVHGSACIQSNEKKGRKWRERRDAAI